MPFTFGVPKNQSFLTGDEASTKSNKNVLNIKTYRLPFSETNDSLHISFCAGESKCTTGDVVRYNDPGEVGERGASSGL